jgi:hypothetical protein
MPGVGMQGGPGRESEMIILIPICGNGALRVSWREK